MDIYENKPFYAETSSCPLEEAIHIAVEAHAGQIDKGGAPYILHPLRLMNQMESEKARIVAVLHDVLEDTDVTTKDLLRRGIPASAVELVVVLTHKRGVAYADYIQQITRCDSRIPSIVKIADLRDNMRVERLPAPLTPKDVERIDRYRAALQVLLNE